MSDAGYSVAVTNSAQKQIRSLEKDVLRKVIEALEDPKRTHDHQDAANLWAPATAGESGSATTGSYTASQMPPEP
ncbi:MAG TPA: hypothetical protein VI756_28420 [Blastocatellia bacterium]